jgi:hypothetical protein
MRTILQENTYILQFESEKVNCIKFTFLIVVPVNLAEIGIKRWCAHLEEVLDYRLPRSHPIAVVTIKECYVYCGDVDYMTEDEMINLPSELTPAKARPWSPGLLRERVMSRGHATCMAEEGEKLEADRPSQVQCCRPCLAWPLLPLLS